MASAWGKSWGVAFAHAWGRTTPVAATPVIPPSYKDIAARVFAGRVTGDHNAIYIRIGRRRTGPH